MQERLLLSAAAVPSWCFRQCLMLLERLASNCTSRLSVSQGRPCTAAGEGGEAAEAQGGGCHSVHRRQPQQHIVPRPARGACAPQGGSFKQHGTACRDLLAVPCGTRLQLPSAAHSGEQGCLHRQTGKSCPDAAVLMCRCPSRPASSAGRPAPPWRTTRARPWGGRRSRTRRPASQPSRPTSWSS